MCGWSELKKYFRHKVNDLSYYHSCIQWPTKKLLHETWSSTYVLWRSYEGLHKRSSSEQWKNVLRKIYTYENNNKTNRKRATQTENIHKSLPARNNRWKDILGKWTLITDAIKCQLFFVNWWSGLKPKWFERPYLEIRSYAWSLLLTLIRPPRSIGKTSKFDLW